MNRKELLRDLFVYMHLLTEFSKQAFLNHFELF